MRLDATKQLPPMPATKTDDEHADAVTSTATATATPEQPPFKVHDPGDEGEQAEEPESEMDSETSELLENHFRAVDVRVAAGGLHNDPAAEHVAYMQEVNQGEGAADVEPERPIVAEASTDETEEQGEFVAAADIEKGDPIYVAPAIANDPPRVVYLDDPRMDSMNSHLQEIRKLRQTVRKAKFALELAKEEVKEKKATWEQAVLELGDLIDQGPEELPLFDRSQTTSYEYRPAPSPSLVDPPSSAKAAPDATSSNPNPAEVTAPTEATAAETSTTSPAKEDDSWKSVTMEEIGLPTGICTSMREVDLKTMGDVNAWTAAGKQLSDIPKVGPAKVEKIEAAFDAFWAKWNAKQTAGQKVNDLPEAPADAIGNQEEEAAAKPAESTEQATEEPAPKKRGKKKGIRMDASQLPAADDYEYHLGTCDEIMDLIEQASSQENPSSDGEAFLSGVSETLSSFRMDIAEKKRATQKQLDGLENMRESVQAWIRD